MLKILKSKLYNILNDLEAHKSNANELIQLSISERLKTSQDNYYKSISDSYNYLSARNSLRVMKKLNRRK